MTDNAAEIKSAGRRIPAIDYLRGVALIYMIFFHFAFDMAYVFPTAWGRALYQANEEIVVLDTSTFIFLAGLSCAFSRSNLRRGGRLLAIAIVFTVVTAFFFPGEAIYFGILHLMSVGMVLFGAFEERLKKIPFLPAVILCALLFAATYGAEKGYFGLKGLWELPVPEELLQNSLLYPLGFITPGFASVDYVPLLPWIFLFAGGAYVGLAIFRRRDSLPEAAYADPLPWLSFVGRHTLIVYILHQPVMIAAIYLARLIAG